MNAENGEPKRDENKLQTDNADDNTSDDNSVSSAALVDLHACGICFQLYNDSERLPKVLSCGHTNCLTCLNKWLKCGTSPFPTCPVCRKITRRPVHLLPNNFQLLQVLRRMKLISTDNTSTQGSNQETSRSVEDVAPGMTSVCEQIDEHMNEVASLLESQLDRLSAQNVDDEHPLAAETEHLLRTVETASADLLLRWDQTKQLLLTRKMRVRENLSTLFHGYPAFSDFLAGGRHFDDERTLDFSEDEPFERLHEFLALESDTPPHAYSDFSLFGSESSHETAVSASDTSSQRNENVFGFGGRAEDSSFSHISTIAGTFGNYSYCDLCHCRLPTNRDSHRTHILGRRHQHALGVSHGQDAGNALGYVGYGRNSNTVPFQVAAQLMGVIVTDPPTANTSASGAGSAAQRRNDNHQQQEPAGTDRRRPTQQQNNAGNRRRYSRNPRNPTRSNTTNTHTTVQGNSQQRPTDTTPAVTRGGASSAPARGNNRLRLPFVPPSNTTGWGAPAYGRRANARGGANRSSGGFGGSQRNDWQSYANGYGSPGFGIPPYYEPAIGLNFSTGFFVSHNY
ncbi:hypothetical protein Q1695_010076 [Nippostrongylus brasiliensis]|nr:hypothetical protein Q1695_010076 [Nippostrongylus brasiliensis]